MFVNLLLLTLGLVFGSFISALSYRYPRKMSVTRGRSICPNCKHKIAWYDNIPLFSFLVLGGKCRNCKKPISWRYPLIELATSLGFLLISLNIYYLIVFCILVAIFVVDFENQIIPDDFIFLGILVSAFTIYHSPFTYLFSGFLAASLLMFLHIVTKGRGMGLGDVKFAVWGGMLVGLPMTLVWLFLAFLTGGITGIILILGRRAGLKDQIAFGPFLIISIGLTFIYGDRLLNLLFLR
jgi:leader peptidase (prepilin peptidase)/N-methyltransferase